MTDEPVEVFTYEDLVGFAQTGYFGTHYERMLESMGGGTGDYTVYWPRDSIRVIYGSSYAVARTIASLLRDSRTRWMGQSTATVPAVVSRLRRPLGPNNGFVSEDQVLNRSTIYQKDRLLGWDISTRGEIRERRESGRHHTFVFDFSTLPE